MGQYRRLFATLFIIGAAALAIFLAVLLTFSGSDRTEQ
jgi:hypothetical protein